MQRVVDLRSRAWTAFREEIGDDRTEVFPALAPLFEVANLVQSKLEQVSLDLKAEFPDAKGFSVRNLWYMKRWYLFYSGDASAAEALRMLESSLDMGSQRLQQVAAETTETQPSEKVQQLAADAEVGARV